MNSSSKIVLAALLVGLLITSGCINLRHMSGSPKSIHLADLDWGDSDTIDIILDAENKYYGITTDRSVAATPSIGLATREVYREIYGSKMLEIIDYNYDAFRVDIVKMRKGFDASSDLAAVAFDTGSVLIGADSTKSILAALSGLTIASKTSINKTYFYEQTLPLLISQMDANRETVLKDIYAGLKGTAPAYPLHQLRHDLARYAHAGTVDGAITASLQQATQQQKNAQKDIRSQLDADLKISKSRIQLSQELVKTQGGFDSLRNAIAIWWAALSLDEKGNQLLPLYKNLKVIGIDDSKMPFYTPTPPPVGVPSVNQFAPFLQALAFDASNTTSGQILANIALNAHDLSMPSTK